MQSIAVPRSSASRGRRTPGVLRLQCRGCAGGAGRGRRTGLEDSEGRNVREVLQFRRIRLRPKARRSRSRVPLRRSARDVSCWSWRRSRQPDPGSSPGQPGSRRRRARDRPPSAGPAGAPRPRRRRPDASPRYRSVGIRPDLFRHAKNAFGHRHPNCDPVSLGAAVCAANG